MNKIVWCGAAAIMALTPLHAASAQGYGYAKDSDNVLNSTSSVSTSSTTTAAPATMVYNERVTTIEPAAGSSYDEGHMDYADFTGPYIGADVGYSIGSYEVNDPVGPDGDVGPDGMNAGLFVGYGFTQSLLSWLGGYAGIELGYEWDDADGNIGSMVLEKDHNFLATFRPGLVVNQDMLGYGVIGYSRAKFEANGDDEYADGLVLGLGGEFDTHTPVKLRVEYDYTNYGDTDMGGVEYDGHESAVKAGAVLRF